MTVSRILKKGKELLTQTSACVCCRIGHFLKLSKSSCPSCIEFLYQHSHCPLKGILEYFCSLLVTFVNYVVLSFTAEIWRCWNWLTWREVWLMFITMSQLLWYYFHYLICSNSSKDKQCFPFFKLILNVVINSLSIECDRQVYISLSCRYIAILMLDVPFPSPQRPRILVQVPLIYLFIIIFFLRSVKSKLQSNIFDGLWLQLYSVPTSQFSRHEMKKMASK